VHVERVEAARTFPLRQRILRPHETLEELALPGDDDPDAGHFAAIDDDRDAREPGAVIGTASVRRDPPPWALDDTTAWRLRGMATEEGRRSEGVGGAVLSAVIDHVAAHGGGLLWCNARTPAQRFYERAGFTTRGESWVDPVIGPHVVMVLAVPGG
jgi:GNAT superfamily N-acetyltransferase